LESQGLILRPPKKSERRSEPRSKTNSTMSILGPLFETIDSHSKIKLDFGKSPEKRVKKKDGKQKKMLSRYHIILIFLGNFSKAMDLI